ncbi:MAG: 5-formyltetrahydrofolate cyclo-ligase [Oligoflexia bacterium]|nr:5-formyltetrahydrofolate cyclo-ligase [Oligoflexia bacterium]
MSSQSKNVWRAHMLETRSELGPDKINQFNREICKNVSSILTEAGGLGDLKHRPLWAGYKSFRWEADPAQAVIECAPSIRWAFPRVLPDTQMEFLEPFLTDCQWIKNSWGIWEPDIRTAEKINLSDCMGVLVPGVAFDRQGHRLGYGKGYYDRVLADFKGLKVGVAFSVQITPETLPHDDQDVAMDLIVTDTEIVRIKTGRH